jgi:hypothetical protein
MATCFWQIQRLPTPPKPHSSIYSFHHGNRKWRPSPIPGLGYLQKTGCHTKCTASPQTQISTSKPNPIITHPINKSYYLLWHTEPELIVLKTAYRSSCCSWGNSSNRNGYKDRQIHRGFNLRPHLVQPDDPNLVIFLSFIKTIFNCISKVLAQYNIKSVDLPHVKLFSLLRPVHENLRRRMPGVYRFPCECLSVYFGHTDRSVDIRLKELQRHIRLEHPDKSAVAQHSMDYGHRSKFHNSSILPKKTRYMDHIVRVAIEIELRPCNINKEGGFCLNKSWKTHISSLKFRDMTQG